MVFDPLSDDERERLMAQPRPRRRLQFLGEDELEASGVQSAARSHAQLREQSGARPSDAPRGYAPLALTTRPRDQKARPIYAVWEVTLACDLACRHCGSRAGHARPDELSTAECLDLVQQMAALGIREVTLIGGEAYLRPDWLDIVREIRRCAMTPTMTTGGRGLDAQMARDAKSAGLASVSVSLDGLSSTHDRLRGVLGSHTRALLAMDHLKNARIPFSVNTQINRLSLPELPELLELMAARGAHSWQLQLTVPMGRAADEPDVLLQPYDMLELFPLLAQLRARCDVLGVRFLPGNNVGYFGPYESTLRKHMPGGHAGSCSAGQLTLGLEADGTIKGCPSLPTKAWAGGNVREHSLRDIWERATPLRYTRDRTLEDLWGYCRSCYYADNCRAGCTWTSDVFFAKPGNNPYCHHRALEHARLGKRERLVRAEQAPGKPFDHGRFEIVIEDNAPRLGSALPTPERNRTDGTFENL